MIHGLADWILLVVTFLYLMRFRVDTVGDGLDVGWEETERKIVNRLANFAVTLIEKLRGRQSM